MTYAPSGGYSFEPSSEEPYPRDYEHNPRGGDAELWDMVIAYFPRVRYFVLKDSELGHFGWEPEYIRCPTETTAFAVVHGR